MCLMQNLMRPLIICHVRLSLNRQHNKHHMKTIWCLIKHIIRAVTKLHICGFHDAWKLEMAECITKLNFSIHCPALKKLLEKHCTLSDLCITGQRANLVIQLQQATCYSFTRTYMPSGNPACWRLAMLARVTFHMSRPENK